MISLHFDARSDETVINALTVSSGVNFT